MSSQEHRCDRCEFTSDSARGLVIHVSRKHKAAKRERKATADGETRKAPKRSNDEGSHSEKAGSDEHDGDKGKEEEEEEQEEASPALGTLKVGFKVCVRLTGHLRDFQCCHMDGTVQKIEHKTVKVKLDALGREVKVPRECIGPQRGPEPHVQWQVGDQVHVLETNEGIEGWWEATIVGRKKNLWKVRWQAGYEEHGDEDVVEGSCLRRAGVPQ